MLGFTLFFRIYKQRPESLVGTDDEITAETAALKPTADIDSDSRITSRDAQDILIFFLNHTVLDHPALWDELLQ